MIRAFVAVELNQELRQAIGRVQAQTKERLMKRLPTDARIQWVRPESIHLTLKFLGDIAERRVDEMRHALAATIGSASRFTVEVGGLGVFPDHRAPRVLWIGLADASHRLSRLAADIDSALTALGFAPEGKPFTPHLTLARIKEKSREVGQALTASGALTEGAQAGRLTVRSVALMRSELKPSGSVYTRLWEVPLHNDER